MIIKIASKFHKCSMPVNMESTPKKLLNRQESKQPFHKVLIEKSIFV